MKKYKAKTGFKKRWGFGPLLLFGMIILAFSTDGSCQSISSFAPEFSLVKRSGNSVRSLIQVNPPSVDKSFIGDTYAKPGLIRKFADSQFFVRTIRPPINGARILGELAFGFGVGILAILVAQKIGTEDYDFLSGYPIGVSLGVHAIGIAGDERGSFLATLLGGIVGIALAIPAISGSNEDLKSILYLLGPPIGACIGFNLTRSYKSIYNLRAFLSYQKGQLEIGLPQLQFCPSALGRGALAFNVSLLSVEL